MHPFDQLDLDEIIKLKSGTDKLTEKFDEYHITELLDVQRPNVCKPPKSQRGLFGKF